MTVIRRATLADGAAAIQTLRRSITELCLADHHNEAEKLDPWLRNKTLENWAKWVAQDDAVLMVADSNGAVVGVGATTLHGMILLNYVHPEARFSGVSKALLAALEAELRQGGIRLCRLETTLTARAFYAGCGYRADPDGTFLVKDLQL